MKRLVPLLLCALVSTATTPSEPRKSLNEAVERNEIVSLKSIMNWIEKHYVGQVVEVELENEGDFFSYEVDLLTPDGAKIEFQFNASSGELLSVSGRDIERAKRK